MVQEIYSKMDFVSCTHAYHNVTDSVNHWMVKNTNLNIWIMKHNISLKQKNSEPLPQMAHFEKLLFYSGCNLLVGTALQHTDRGDFS